jgi:hypothetical protein
VDTGGEALLVGDAVQQVGELGGFGRFEGSRGSWARSSRPVSPIICLPVIGKVQGVLPPVGAVALSAEESTLIQFVDEADNSAG